MDCAESRYNGTCRLTFSSVPHRLTVEPEQLKMRAILSNLAPPTLVAIEPTIQQQML